MAWYQGRHDMHCPCGCGDQKWLHKTSLYLRCCSLCSHRIRNHTHNDVFLALSGCCLVWRLGASIACVDAAWCDQELPPSSPPHPPHPTFQPAGQLGDSLQRLAAPLKRAHTIKLLSKCCFFCVLGSFVWVCHACIASSRATFIASYSSMHFFE